MSEVIRRLKRRYGREMRTSLDHSSAWELLVATMLSAQSQDKQVNIVTKRLFKRFPKLSDYVNLRPVELYPYIGSLGLFRNKAKNIVAAARRLRSDFGSKVPRSMDEMLTIPGVGRKTANVVLSNAYGINEGIAIDTHCIVVSNRLGFVRTRDPVKIEKRFMNIVDKDEWANLTHLLIALGRDVCTARMKHCGSCVLNDICPASTVKIKG